MNGKRLQLVRNWLTKHGLRGFVQPHEDEFLGEFIPAAAERLAWLTGFTGSAGTAVILEDRAALFVDGRYTIQARSQVETGCYEVLNSGSCPPGRWLADAMRDDAGIGFDPRLFSVSRTRQMTQAVERAGGQLIPMDSNPIDEHWTDRPPPPAGSILAHPIRYAGESSADKRSRLAAVLKQHAVAAAVLTSCESVAWLLNIRGSDLPYSPVALATAILTCDGTAQLFANPVSVTDEVRSYLGDAVSLHPRSALPDSLSAFGANQATVQLDPASTPVWIHTLLTESGADVRHAPDPVELPRAVKNSAELRGMRDVHEIDGLAMAKFLCWLDANALAGNVTECSAVQQLEAFRRGCPDFRSPSFPTISGTGPHGAVVHYRATPETDRQLRPGDLYLVDSGGQYPGGTTDVTRTVAVGRPEPQMRDRFTRVLKGHIALATARFPVGTPGGQLDILARAPLWEAGLSYDHGTGHGVGSFLNVHEGPQSISFRIDRTGPPTVSKSALVPLTAGMVISNEPGYYLEDAYGIRIENLVAVRDEPEPEGAEFALLGFETLTLAPIDRRLIVADMLNPDEVRWLDDYHQRVVSTLSPRLAPGTRDWLVEACAPLRR
ncbi:MAG: aminopeptidase P family protein [Rhodospirillales bacterium]|nr:aminopeptidase P family protein [Rhodospirillales bacterium]MYE19548.1 aminopeptidase P family protein [Rhodospirillales bacterium]